MKLFYSYAIYIPLNSHLFAFLSVGFFSIDIIHLIHGATAELVLKSCKHEILQNDDYILCLLQNFKLTNGSNKLYWTALVYIQCILMLY